MRGSEKQIAWANEIINRVVTTLEALRPECIYDPDDLMALNERIEAVKAAEYAGNIIELFKDFRQSGDTDRDIRSLAAIYRVSLPRDDDQRRILGK